MSTVSFPIPPMLRDQTLSRVDFVRNWRLSVAFMVGGVRVMPSLSFGVNTYARLQEGSLLTEVTARGPSDVSLHPDGLAKEHHPRIAIFGQDEHTQEEWDAFGDSLILELDAARQAAQVMLFGTPVEPTTVTA